MQHNLPVLINLAAVNATTEIRDKDLTARQIEPQTNRFVEPLGEDLFGADGLCAIFAELDPVQRVTTR